MDGDAWTTIESDPGVFTELIADWGVSGVQVEEIYALDSDSLAHFEPIYGLVFLFKWQEEVDDRPTLLEEEYRGLFFARQVITNACATQALLAILLNRPELELGRELTELKNFTADFSPELRGHAISNSESIRRAHNSFRPPNPVISEERPETAKSEDVYHFIAYVPAHGGLYELDGLKAGPIRLCECSEADRRDWLPRVQPFIQARMDRYSSSEIRFNLLAVIRDQRTVLAEQLRAATEAPGTDAGPGEVAQVQLLRERLSWEEQKHDQWRADNVRRRHNYIPFAYNLLRILAEEGQLRPIIENAQTAKGNS